MLQGSTAMLRTFEAAHAHAIGLLSQRADVQVVETPDVIPPSQKGPGGFPGKARPRKV